MKCFRAFLISPITPFIQGPESLTYKRFGLFPFRSPLLRGISLISFPEGTEMFHFPSFALRELCIHSPSAGYTSGFPHSEISGSTRVCRFPKLMAAYHLLHRFLTPRHSPQAINNFQTLDIMIFSLKRLKNPLS